MRKLSAVLVVFLLILSLVSPVLATTTDRQYTYSSTSNSGRRHETCTTLQGTKADNYYTSSYTYEKLSALSSSSLLTSLRTLMKSTHKTNTSYDQCRDLTTKTDCENGNGKIVMLYSSYSATYSQYQGGNGWNREHVWPKSLGGFQTSGAGADLHHIRPAEANTNTRRSNQKYGNVSSGTTATGNLSGLYGGTYNGTYFEPNDNVKGDVARICLYIYVRYGGEINQCSSITNVFQSVDVLLQWCQADPVDTWEMGRNEVVYAIQGNRNVFIDYPEYAWLLFGRQIPKSMTTPSGKAANFCAHAKTQLRNQVSAQCTESGYSGDTYCLDCGTCLATGTTISATGHRRTQLQNKSDATCGKAGYTGDVYCLDCEKVTITGIPIPATGNHNFSEWLLRPGGGHKDRVCQACGYVETEPVPSSCSHVSEYIVTIQPTCTTAGWGGNFCSKCNHYLGEGKDIPATGHQHTEIRNKATANCTTDGHTGDTWCTDCKTKIKAGQTIPATGHQRTEVRNKSEANCTTDGFTGDTYCTDCNTKTADGEVIPATGHGDVYHRNQKDATCSADGHTGDAYCVDCDQLIAGGSVIPATGHLHTEIRGQKDATCAEAGSTGDTYCADCNTKIADGETIPATADHVYGPIAPGGQQTYQECTICGHRVVIDLEDDRPGVDWVVIGIAVAAIVIIGGGIVAIVIIKKRKR